MALLMDMFFLCVVCLTGFENCLEKQFTIFLGVIIILLLNFMEVFIVGALLDRHVWSSKECAYV